ncbi:MAG: NnrU family protein [Gammaproteobacteria bacterium]|nr:NnrU family protein [Gammaproteobacteria bacterium]
MTQLMLAVLFFVGIHVFIAASPMRQQIIKGIGEKAYFGLFGVSALLGLVWMVWAYRHAPYQELWGQVYRFRGLALVGVLLAIFFAVLGLISTSPVAMRRRPSSAELDGARGIYRITRYPLLTGVAIWATVHLLFNGDLASLIFFGGFVALAIGEVRGIERRQREIHGEAWGRFSAQTSVLPLLAILRGRNHLTLAEIGFWRLLAALLVYVGVLHGHEHLFGVSPLAGTYW